MIDKIKEKILDEIRYGDLNNDNGLLPTWLNKSEIPHHAEYMKCFQDGVTCKQYTDAVIVKNAFKDGGWIPCSEDLPKQEGEYLVTCLDYKDKPYACTLYYGYVNESDDEMCFHEWDDDMWDCWKPDVIAWMPKPKPYKPIK